MPDDKEAKNGTKEGPKEGPPEGSEKTSTQGQQGPVQETPKEVAKPEPPASYKRDRVFEDVKQRQAQQNIPGQEPDPPDPPGPKPEAPKPKPKKSVPKPGAKATLAPVARQSGLSFVDRWRTKWK